MKAPSCRRENEDEHAEVTVVMVMMMINDDRWRFGNKLPAVHVQYKYTLNQSKCVLSSNITYSRGPINKGVPNDRVPSVVLSEWRKWYHELNKQTNHLVMFDTIRILILLFQGEKSNQIRHKEVLLSSVLEKQDITPYNHNGWLLSTSLHLIPDHASCWMSLIDARGHKSVIFARSNRIQYTKYLTPACFASLSSFSLSMLRASWKG